MWFGDPHPFPEREKPNWASRDNQVKKSDHTSFTNIFQSLLFTTHLARKNLCVKNCHYKGQQFM